MKSRPCRNFPSTWGIFLTLQWRHNGHDSGSNHKPHDCLHNLLFRRRSKKTSKLRVTGLCAGNSPETGEFHAQMPSNAENVSIWWRHHDTWYRYAPLREDMSCIKILILTHIFKVICSWLCHIGQRNRVHSILCTILDGLSNDFVHQNYHKVSNIRCTKSQNLNAYRLVL